MAIELPAQVDPEAPFFAPDATVRRVHNEGILILGGARALLMQISHPAVARGVAAHSSYKGDRVGRLLRTLRATFAMIYGTREQAAASAAGINHLHTQVKGEGYDALDPDLLLWVFATLIDTTIVMRERFVAPLSPGDEAAYYDDVRVMTSLLQIPDSHLPADLASLQSYVEEMSRTLQVSDEARSIAGDILAPLPWTGPSMWLMRQLTAGLLHPNLREGFDLSWGPMRERQLQALQAASRAVLPKLPMALRKTPSFVLPPSV